jgi:hypothetical protein
VANKENVTTTKTKQALEKAMGPSKLKKAKPVGKQDIDLDLQFEELMVNSLHTIMLTYKKNSRSIPVELRCKLRSVDESVKKTMLKNHSSLSHSPTKTSPSKLFRMGSSADLLSSPGKKAKKTYNTVSVPSSPVKAHPAAIFTEGKVWDVEMQSVQDARTYFVGIKVADIDVGMVKKLWQLLRNESILYDNPKKIADVDGLRNF